MAPAVPEARELRLALARVVVDRDLLDLEPLLARADHHLGCELHPGGPQVEARQRRAPDRAHAAVRVAHAGAEEEVEDPGEHRVPDVAVEPGHRAGLDALHAVAHHEVGALVELGHEARDVAEVVGEVGVGHHDVVALRGGEAGAVGAAVAAPRLVHHQRRRPPRASSALRSSEPLSATITSPSQPWPSSAARASVTQRSIDAASFRQGITTDTLTVEEPSPSTDGGRVVCSSVLRGRASKAGVATVLTRGDGRSCALSGDPSARSASLCRFHARLSGLRLPVSVHRRRCRAVVPQPGRTAGRRRTRGHLPHPAAVGSRRARRGAGRARGERRPAHGALRARRAPAGAAAARVRRRRALAPPPPRPPLRRGPHRVVSVLLAAGGGARAPAAPLPARGRLARGLERRLLARVPRRRWAAASARPSRRSACAFRSAPSASRSCTPGACEPRP